MTSAPDLVNAAGDVGAGHVLGRYELLLPIASGGMAMVWAARLKGTRGFQKIVAIKTMLPKLSEDDQFEQMFLDEASLASQIRHPHVVEIMDLGEEDGILYLVMELVDGVPLNQLMKAAKRGGGIPLPIATRIVMQASAGLHAAHELRNPEGQRVGLVHRDVSPQNILVTYEGVTKVVDFGIAKATAMGGGATVAGQIKGKVAYMAPEQVKGGVIDRRVDVFALGIVLYALTTGKHPLRRESEAATMYSICSPDPVVPPSKIIQGYPVQLERVVLRALAKDLDKRYVSANELLRALDALPPTMRAGTDEDVGNFVKSLFGERRDERRASLQHALELADRQAIEEQRGLRPAQSSGSLSGVSGITATSGSGLRLEPGALPSPLDTSAAPSTPNTLDVGVLDAPAPSPGRRRLLLSAAVLALLTLTAGVIVIAMTWGDRGAAAGGGEEEPAEPPSAAVRTPAVAPVVPSSPRAEGVDVEALPVVEEPVEPAPEPSLAPPPPPPPTPAPRPGAGGPRPPVGATPPSGTGKTPSWNKQDPGF